MRYSSKKEIFTSIILLCSLIISGFVVKAIAIERDKYFFIKVIDDRTGRGVPLVELTTTNSIRLFTDSDGMVAFDEECLLNREVFFFVKSPGYEFKPDGFGMTGTKLFTKPGNIAEVKIHRLMPAERIYRITGEGIYRDSLLAGQKIPVKEPMLNASIMGQDSAQAVLYKDRVFWFWGDTMRPCYPLGLFEAAGAISKLPQNGGLDPDKGIDLEYFTDSNDFSRAMCPIEGDGPVWLDGLLVVDTKEGPKMLSHYSRMKDLGTMLEHGIAIYNDSRHVFESVKVLSLAKRRQCPHSHSFKFKDRGVDFFMFGEPFANVRVKANLKDILDSNSYQFFSCLKKGTKFDGANSSIDYDDSNRPIWSWQYDTDPLGAKDEKELFKAGLIKKEDLRFLPADSNNNEILLVSGSCNYNSFLKKYIIVAGEFRGTSSLLGEIWITKSESPTGPFRKAVKVATHTDYSFYNPVHHVFFDANEGKTIYFEGTYSSSFSGTKVPTPKYDYNQIMYKLNFSSLYGWND